MTFSLYDAAEEGVPLWVEIQPVVLAPTGAYDTVLGSTTPLAPEVFASGEARWVEGHEEQSRVLLVSVPYALKAGDADTLGGLPASAFLRAGAAGDLGVVTTEGAVALKADGPVINGLDTVTDNLTVNNRIGVGTSSPMRQLHLNGSGQSNPLVIDVAANRHAGMWLRENGANKWQLYNESGSDALQLFSFPANRRVFTVQPNGYVGIGTVSPTRQLHLKGSTENNPLVVDVAANRHAGLWLREDGANRWQFYNDSPTGDFRLFSYGKPGIVFSLQGASDNLGLGTTSPSTKLDVVGTVTAQAFVGDGSGPTGPQGPTGGGWTASGNDAHTTGSGLVGVGTSSPGSKLDVAGTISGTKFRDRTATSWALDLGTGAASSIGGAMARPFGIGIVAPLATLHVRNDAGFPGNLLRIESNNGSVDAPFGLTTRLYLTTTGLLGVNTGASASAHLHARGDGSSTIARFDNSSGTTQVSIDAAGKFFVNQQPDCTVCTGFNNLSDRRLKTDVAVLGDALSTLGQLRPVRFRYSSEMLARHPGVGGHERFGFIAQEYGQVFPDSVHGGDDGYLRMGSDNLLPYTVRGVQQLVEMIAERDREATVQRQRIDSLEAEMAELRRLIAALADSN